MKTNSKSMNENFYKHNQSKMHFDTNRKYYNVNELLDEVQDLRDRARHIRKKRTKDGFTIKSRSLIGHRIFYKFLKISKTRRFDGFGMPFGHEGRMRVVPYNMTHIILAIFEFNRY